VTLKAVKEITSVFCKVIHRSTFHLSRGECNFKIMFELWKFRCKRRKI